MGTYKVNLSERAGRDIFGIIRYITQQLKEPEAARNIAEQIDEAIDRLMEMPERYAIVVNERLKAKGIRRVPVENYLIFLPLT